MRTTRCIAVAVVTLLAPTLGCSGADEPSEGKSPPAKQTSTYSASETPTPSGPVVGIPVVASAQGFAAGTELRSIAILELLGAPNGSLLRILPIGSAISVVDSVPTKGFLWVKHSGLKGWVLASALHKGTFVAGRHVTDPASVSDTTGEPVGDSPVDPTVGPGSDPVAADDPASEPEVDPITSTEPETTSAVGIPDPRDVLIARAQSSVGFSYYWGHGSWLPGSASVSPGVCSGASCPACSHAGSYGADCSGLVGKIWGVPSWNEDVSIDSHPYGTVHFIQDTAQWYTISRDTLERGDALVYNQNGEGHIFLYESGDGWGSMWVYEARDCPYPILHALRSAGLAFKGIRKAGL